MNRGKKIKWGLGMGMILLFEGIRLGLGFEILAISFKTMKSLYLGYVVRRVLMNG